MGYKIFYSYQSDISKKLNQFFIREAINLAIDRIKDYDIEPLIEGFYGKGGNPPLAETMLEQSRDADIFIGDVTFTSSKIWQSKGVVFNEDANSYLIEIEKPVDLKPAPNPNVLLETGYSWALKTYERTILVMNTAFDVPSRLPVDMKNIRWPITYNLSEERLAKASKYRKELENLTIALEEAIRDAINSSIQYQEKILSPLQTYHSWATLYRTSFILRNKTKTIITELRELIGNDNKPVRIVGPSKSGMSRLLFELFRKNEDLEENSEYLNRIVYHDYNGALEGDISQKLDLLSKQNLDKVLILDNCPDNKTEKIEELFIDSKVKLITTSNTSHSAHNEYIISERDVLEICIEILETKFSYNKAVELANELNGNLKKVVLNLSENVSSEGQTSTLELIKQEIGQGNVDKGAIELLTNISLFKHLGVRNWYEHELVTFKTIFYPGESMESVNSIIEILLVQNLINRKGDFVQVQIDEEELVYEWWKNIDATKIDTLHNLNNDRLLYRFFEQLIKTHKSNAIPALEQNLFGTDKFLIKNDFYTTEMGQKFLNDLAPIYPERVLDISELIVNNLLK
ncbi:hypothetical protein SAMN05192540_2853 [Maribacter dokdonensis]|uniref:Uncharacterized protein n=1 Tax=Maribacter dokdonensis TaxID=320912 RepID=A0A1H4RFQ0_9FLAO|nr:hypothetical protein [Maribacter dokdonensis]SEC30707.1 hypothetical protein SAMN05192540_2853 [Maribacter dokdonensis]